VSLFSQGLLDTHDELIVDLFAGGGGASSGIEEALGRQVDIAINHNATAVSLHQANHPQTKHYVSDVFEVDPRQVCDGRRPALLWASPDCTFHSKARGRKPIRHANKKRRALAWVVVRWAAQVRPRVIMLENVEEFAQWGPLIGKADMLRPCPKRRGRTFRKFVNLLRAMGYIVEWRELRACDYGAPTIRKRLFLIARCDGQAIIWPEPTHGPGKRPYRCVADCIDWSVPMCSIFATREEAGIWAKANGVSRPQRPLAENTLRRVARGVEKFVLKARKPFLVSIANQSVGRWGSGVVSVDNPLPTTTTKAEQTLVAPILGTYYGDKPGAAVRGQALDGPLATQTTENRHALTVAFLAQNNGGFCDTSTGQSADSPLGTITTEGGGKAALVASLIAQYNGTAVGQQVDAPLNTISTRDRFGLVTVEIEQTTYYIADILMRMLTPRELYLCQGFRPGYIIDRGAAGEVITKSEQIRLVGNSVCPPLAEALVLANCADLKVRDARRVG